MIIPRAIRLHLEASTKLNIRRTHRRFYRDELRQDHPLPFWLWIRVCDQYLSSETKSRHWTVAEHMRSWILHALRMEARSLGFAWMEDADLPHLKRRAGWTPR